MNKRPDAVPMPFDKIMPAVSAGQFDYGVIIHEGRFTYENYGLDCLLDLGQWWESATSLPIPLGGIGMRRDLPDDDIYKTESIIRESIKFAHSNPSAPSNYIKTHAQELSDEVLRQHIALYVNEFSLDIDDEGEAAIEALLGRARKKGIMPNSSKPLFACTRK